MSQMAVSFPKLDFPRRSHLKLACVGSVCLDVFVGEPTRLPIQGELLQVPYIGIHPGGSGSNTGVVFALLGGNARIIARLGDDEGGVLIIRSFLKDSIPSSGIMTCPGCRTATAIVMVSPDGERSFLYSPGANEELSYSEVQMHLKDMPTAVHFSDNPLLRLLYGAPTLRLLADARRRGILTSMDACGGSLDKWSTLAREYLPLLDIFFCNQDEATELTGELLPIAAATALLSYGGRCIVVKNGASGCVVATSSGVDSFSATPVRCVDSTGAGDAFVAAFLLNWLDNGSYEDAACFANQVAAITVTQYGATTAVRDLVQHQAGVFARNGTPIIRPNGATSEW